MECGRLLLVAVLAVIKQTGSQYVAESPCPNVFRYEQDMSGGLYGLITVPNPLPFVAIDLKVSVYITERVPPGNAAKLTLVNSNAWQRLAAGDRSPVLYRLDFPLPSPLPTIKDITVNEEVICSGAKPSASLLTTLSLLHAIYDDRCSSSSLQCPFNVQGSGGKPVSSQPPQPQQSSGYVPQSPCPEIFSYQHDNFGNWYGLINIPNPYPIVAIDLRVGIYLTEYVPRGSKSSLELVNNLREEWRRMRTGERYSVPYRLTFPLQSPLPTVKSITANNELLCMGNRPASSRIQTFSYQHGIYNEKCSSSSLDCPYNIVDMDYPAVTPPTPPTRPPTPPPTLPPPPPPTQPTTRQPQPPTEPPTNSGIQCGKPVIRTNPLIFFGQPTERGQWPWHAAIYQLEGFGTRRYSCGGSFIGTKSILTAAHCVAPNGKLLEAGKFLVFLGRYDLRSQREDGAQELEVDYVFVHPEYNSTKYQADVAIIILASSVSITEFVRPVCLWNQRDISLQSIVQKEGVVVGWGLDEDSNTAEVLKMVKMPIVEQQTCLWSNPTFFSQFTSTTTFCAGFRNGSSVCNGDSGGGLVLPKRQSDGSVMWMLRGIVSNSKPKDNISRVCDTKNYIIFTDAAQYLDWITAIFV